MMTDTEIRIKGADALRSSLGMVEAERFISLILREPFDYTKWRQDLFEDSTIEKVSAAAMRLRNRTRAGQDGADQAATAGTSNSEE
ncbi:MAG: hypothetical protein ACI957_004000 [Verrucomicrobiales bacterium]|jgi:hypothetical protein